MASKKRGFNELNVLDLAAKFRSKCDMHVYLTEKVSRGLRYYHKFYNSYNTTFPQLVATIRTLLKRYL
jgi:hypothetical protein